MNQEEIEGYIDRSQDIIESSPQMNEANTKKKLIEPLIDLLGWNTYSDEVQLEYPVQIATGTKKVDYALTLEGTPVVFVEAKGLDNDLTDRHATQVTSYMHNQEGVQWGLLTNGRRFRFYRYDGTKSGRELGTLKIDEIAHNKEVVRTLSKKSIKEGKSEEIAEGIQKRREAVRNLRDGKEEIANEISSVVTSRVGESVAPVVENEAKELVDRVVDAVANSRNPAEIEQYESDEEQVESGDSDVVLTAGDTIIEEFEEGTQSETYAEVVKYLIEERDFLEDKSLPYCLGRKRAVINDKPEHPNGEEMSLPVDLENGYYLETHKSKKGKERYISQMAGNVGLGVEFNW